MNSNEGSITPQDKNKSLKSFSSTKPYPKLNLKYNSLSSKNKTLISSRHLKKIPILAFPLRNKQSEIDYTQPFFRTAKLFKPVLISKTIEKSIKRKETTKKINIIDFGKAKFKIYDKNERKQKKKAILDKAEKQLNEIYYDYDKVNRHIITNSFTGNGSDLLRNKVCFVHGIVNFIYPRLVLKKINFYNDMKVKQFQDEQKKIDTLQKGKLFLLKHKNPEQNAKISKYLYGGDIEILKKKNNLTHDKKIIINKCIVSKFVNDFDFP